VEGIGFFELVIQNGFSIGIAAFLLLRMEKETKRLASAIEQLRMCQVCKLNVPGRSSGDKGD
jgi:hypothetical protein